MLCTTAGYSWCLGPRNLTTIDKRLAYLKGPNVTPVFSLHCCFPHFSLPTEQSYVSSLSGNGVLFHSQERGVNSINSLLLSLTPFSHSMTKSVLPWSAMIHLKMRICLFSELIILLLMPVHSFSAELYWNGFMISRACHTNRFDWFSIPVLNCEGLFNPLNNLRPKTVTTVRHSSVQFAFLELTVQLQCWFFHFWLSDFLCVFLDCEVYIWWIIFVLQTLVCKCQLSNCSNNFSLTDYSLSIMILCKHSTWSVHLIQVIKSQDNHCFCVSV